MPVTAHRAFLVGSLILNVVSIGLLNRHGSPSPSRPYSIYHRDTTSPPHYTFNDVSPGDVLRLADISFSQHRRTIILALQQGCQFCEESMPFYRRILTATSARPDLNVLAILPQEPSKARNYLESHGVHVSEIRQKPLQALKVLGTPTVIVVDHNSEVQQVWVGLLSRAEEEYALTILSSTT
jgi:hypothetical protein